MRIHFKKLISAVAAAVVALVFSASLPAKAAGGVTVYFQNSANWSAVYCYTWYGSGAVGTAWPGQQMTSVGNGWYSFTYTGDKPLNVVFNDNGKPTPNQTADQNPKDLPLTQSAYWFTLAGSSAQNAGGIGGGTNLAVHNTPESGWPGAAASSSPSSSKAASQSSAASSAASASASKSTSKSASSSAASSPATGDQSPVTAAAGIAVLAVAAMAGVWFTRKKTRS